MGPSMTLLIILLFFCFFFVYLIILIYSNHILEARGNEHGTSKQYN